MSDEVKGDFDVNLDVNPDQFEEQIAAGGIIPAGYYHATLNGAVRTTSKESQRPGWKLTFKVAIGPFAGREVEDTLWSPQDSTAMANRVLLFKHRLGLIKRDDSGKKFVPVVGKNDFMDCIDTPVIIHVKQEEYDRKDGKGKGIAVRLDFNGLFSPDDKKAAEKVGQPVPAADAKPAAKTGDAAKATTTTTAKKVDVSDL